MNVLNWLKVRPIVTPDRDRESLGKWAVMPKVTAPDVPASEKPTYLLTPDRERLTSLTAAAGIMVTVSVRVAVMVDKRCYSCSL